MVPLGKIATLAKGWIEEYRSLEASGDVENCLSFKLRLEQNAANGLEVTERYACREALRVICQRKAA